MGKEKFNELEFIKREYELLRFISIDAVKFSDEAKNKLEAIIEELINNEEEIRYAITVKKDIFGMNQLAGVVTTLFILVQLEKINPDISEKLMENLLYKFQKRKDNIPLILTGEEILGASYLEFLLENTEYKIPEIYHSKIGICLIRSIEKKVNFSLLTSYFVRTDIPIKNKKFVIDALDDEVLYRLIDEWNKSFMNSIVDSLKRESLEFLNEKEAEEFLRELKSMHKEKVSCFTEVVNLINEKLYS